MGLFKDCGCGCNGRKQAEKLIISIISGLTFFIVANPETFRLVRRILGSWICDPYRLPLDSRSPCAHPRIHPRCLGYDEHQEGGWGCPSKKKSGCGCGGAKKGKKVVVAPPVPMEEAPDPRPEFAEPSIEVVDSGRILEPAPIDSEGTLFK